MKRFIFACVCFFPLLGITPAHAVLPLTYWTERFGGTNSEDCRAVAVDASSNIIVTGFYTGTTNLGGSNFGTFGFNDVFLAKYNIDGVHQWSASFGGSLFDQGMSVAVDGSGNVVLTGFFAGSVNFGGGNLVSAGGDDIFLAKYNASGAYQWSFRFGGTSNDHGLAVAADKSGNVLLTGYFQNTANFGGSNLVSAGSNDIFLAKFNASGVHQWSQRFGTGGIENGQGVAVDGSGNVLITGYYFGANLNLGGSTLVNTGGEQVFLAKYDAAGVHQWSQSLGGTTSDFGNAVAVDKSGNVFLAGSFTGTAAFGGSNLVSAGGSDAFLAKYDAAGTHLWSQRFGGTGQDDAYAVAADGSRGVVLTGDFTASGNFGGGTITGGGGADIFVAKYDAAGVHQWSRGFGDTGIDVARGIAVNGPGNVVLAGNFTGTVDFGSGPLVGAGSGDLIVANYFTGTGLNITSIADIGNDQGRKVKIRFDRSQWDIATVSNPVARYVALRRDDPPPAASSGINTGRDSHQHLLASGWTEVGSVSAFGDDSYGIDVPTIGDSTIALGPYNSTFYIRAATALPSTFYDSPIDSGYSVDNLAPGVPQNFAFSAGQLTWIKSSADDFDYFTVYGSSSNSFATATLVNYSVAPTMNVSGSPYVYYFVTATDFSGNEGKPAIVNSLSGVGGTPLSYVLSVSNYPNPFNPRTTVNYTVPQRGTVSVAVYDVHGAFVTTLFHGERTAGAYQVQWDGRAEDGAVVGSGIYFARIEQNGVARTKKMVLLK